MLNKLIRQANKPCLLPRFQGFSTAVNPHKVTHTELVMDSKFYERDFWATSIKEIEFVRSPMYDLARGVYMDVAQTHDFVDDIALKTGMIDETTSVLLTPQKTKENASFIRYSDKSSAPEDQKFIFQQPRA